MVDIAVLRHLLTESHCDPAVADATHTFLLEWGPYTEKGSKFSIYRLFREHIDPAWRELVQRNPRSLSTNIMELAWTKYTLSALQPGTIPGNDGDIVQGSNAEAVQLFTQRSRPKDWSALSTIAHHYRMDRLERFLFFVQRTSPSKHSQTLADQAVIETIDVLRHLAEACSLKLPKRRPDRRLTNRHQSSVCRFCGHPTEAADFHARGSEALRGLPDNTRLSAKYCSRHKSKGPTSPAMRLAYQRAKRSEGAFSAELKRLHSQSIGGHTATYARSGNPLVDEFIRMLVAQRKLHHEEQTTNEAVQSLDGPLHAEARKLVDWRMTDRKKEIVALLAQGLNQSQVAATLNTSRQAVSKALQAIPDEYRLNTLRMTTK
ncbi:hypothetical protein [Castellaniella sp.]|uniref:hypothetical protein n=1 Tax=Castellaniella sp. TaxID=1955812 RepID=UPI002AFF55F5|nr:hypothetical protein [Castellaniella sp.]